MAKILYGVRLGGSRNIEAVSYSSVEGDAAILWRFGKKVVSFKPTPSQWSKIRANKGMLYIKDSQVVMTHHWDNPLRPRLTPYKGKRLPRRNPPIDLKAAKYLNAFISPTETGYKWELKERQTGKIIASGRSKLYEQAEESLAVYIRAYLSSHNPAYAYGPTKFRPPKKWWDMVMASAKAQYRRPKAMSLKKYREALAKVVGGVWSKFPQKTRDAILKKYERK